MRFLTSDATEQRLYGDRLRRGDPSRKSVAFSAEFLHASRPPFNTRTYLSALENGRALPINARWQEWVPFSMRNSMRCGRGVKRMQAWCCGTQRNV